MRGLTPGCSWIMAVTATLALRTSTRSARRPYDTPAISGPGVEPPDRRLHEALLPAEEQVRPDHAQLVLQHSSARMCT